jgi:hypothetical protein
MTKKTCNDVAFISAATIFNADANANTDSENKNSFAYSCPELFY